MYINNTSYNVDLHLVQSIRYCLLSKYDLNHISILEEYIKKYIPNTEIVYNSLTKSFTIKIRKTSIKKIKGYKNNVQFYYYLIGEAFNDFFKEQKEEIIKLLYDSFGDSAFYALNTCINNPKFMYNLFNAYCLADNILEIKL